MQILVIGGTRYIGKHLVNVLLEQGHYVTIATRGLSSDDFGSKVKRLIIDRTDKDSLKKAIPNEMFDVVIDSLAYCSNDVKYLLEIIKCRKYVQVSSASVYVCLHNGTIEEEFDAGKKALVYCGRNDFAYDEIKRQAECAIVQKFSHVPSVRVRFPFVIGKDDYTKRLYFYVEHVIKQQPMYIDNINVKMAFVRSDEAGRFIAYLAETNYTGAINGASQGTISVNEILQYVKVKTGIDPILAKDGDPAPYNGAEDYYLDTGRAEALGFSFESLESWIYELIDYFIADARSGISH